MNRLIIVIGFMGCGKTEVASRLAARLSLHFIDLDDQITQTEGQTPGELIRERGEESFRTIETRVLSDVLSENRNGVVALGGGAWIESVNRDFIRAEHAVCVWLDTPFEVCWERISTSSEDRPLGATREEANTRYEKRLPLYQLADIHIKSSATDDAAGLAARIEDQLLDRRFSI